jgi:hypothetical protein
MIKSTTPIQSIQSIEVPESPVPTVLYKYLPPERIDILENMELRFSRPSEFNDTFDSHYLVPKSQGLKGTTARMRLKSRLGILCLAEQPYDQLMWVHYARNHTGFVLGFDRKASFFHEEHRVLRKVVYQEGPDVLPTPDMNACFFKSDQWKHEHEWRCVREFQPSESRAVRIEPSLLTQIIFGHQMVEWQIARIMQYVTAYEMIHTQILLSTPSHVSWSMTNIPKRMSVCPSCSGNGYLMEEWTHKAEKEKE